ncbi:hypothetical protein RCCGE510_30566 (plasmid) [Rhizobium sp. CCGE 510]|nr:hypothetical protein RCCGE510_30566 [Rhizobium sp. CCGE 510]
MPARYSAIEGALASGFATSVTCTRCGDSIGTTREAFENIRVRQRHYSLGTLLGEAIRRLVLIAAP